MMYTGFMFYWDMSGALELFDMACRLIEQNTDENISELSIRRQMARLHLPVFDGAGSSRICESKLFAEMGITNQTHYDNFGRTAMEVAERRVMTDAELVPELSAIWAATILSLTQ